MVLKYLGFCSVVFSVTNLFFFSPAYAQETYEIMGQPEGAENDNTYVFPKGRQYQQYVEDSEGNIYFRNKDGRLVLVDRRRSAEKKDEGDSYHYYY